ncbi:MAG: hypothetical protein ACRDG4_16140 [Chloroflexota bacterium]
MIDEFPRRTPHYMRAFAAPNPRAIVQHVAAQLPWGRDVRLEAELGTLPAPDEEHE